VSEPTGQSRTWLWTRLGAGLLAVLWAVATVPLALDAAQVVRTHTTTRMLGAPTDAVIVQVQQERALSAGVVDRGALLAQRARTDEAYRRLREALTGPMRRTTVGADAARQADDLLRRLDDRTRLRTIVDGAGADASSILTGYTRIVDAAFAGAPWLWPDRTTGTGSALLAVGRAREALSQQSAVLLAASGPAKLDDPARARVTELALTRRALLAEATGRLSDAARADYQALAAGPAAGRLRTMEDQLLSPGTAVAAAPEWSATVDAYHDRLRAFEVAAVREAGQAPVPGAVATVAGAGLLAGVGLVAVLAVLQVLVRRTATPASRKAPAASGAGSTDTDSRLLRVVLEQNRRNQALLHRLLRLLDGLQRRVDDDGTLDALFRIDHLAGRVRRNVEKAIALTGGDPGRRWTRPVPLMDVVRAAAAEVDGFERVSTAQVEPARLAGASVIDLMHLLAELIENAVAFSPAETRVGVSGRHDGDRYVLTVTDQGAGMPEDDLRIAAEVLATSTPPATDAWHGLYAVGRLAERAALTVRLRNGDDGGLHAEVHLPAALLSGDARPAVPALAVSAVSGDE
jgi:signal transduction histidine kinase